MLLSDSPLQQSARDHLLLHFSRNGSPAPLLVLERGEGPYVFDTEGNRYLDGLSSLFCAQLGYSYGEEMASVAAAQLQKLAFSTVWGAAHPAAIELAERLAELMPGDLDHVFFTERRLGVRRVRLEARPPVPRRQRRAAAHEGDRARRRLPRGHARGARRSPASPRYKEQFGPPAIPVTHVANTNPLPRPRRRRGRGGVLRPPAGRDRGRRSSAEGPDTIAMIIAEPVQNAGGCLTPPDGYWQGLRDARRPPRDPARLRRGHLRLRAPRRVARRRALRRRPGPRHDGEGHHVRLRADGRGHGRATASPRRSTTTRSARCMHGITFAGHPLCAAIALRNLEIFERDGRARERPRGASRTCEAALEELRGAADRRRRPRRRASSGRSSSSAEDDDARWTPTSASACCAATCPAACSRRASSRGPTTAATPCCTSRRR